MCRVLGVSRSGFYAWCCRTPSSRWRANQQLGALIRSIHARSRETYGSPRIQAELRLAHGINCGRNRVARVMAAEGLVGCRRRRRWSTTRKDPAAAKAPDLVDRRFATTAPNRLWMADITFVPTARGYVYLAVVVDAFSRAVVGWCLRRHLQSALVTSALDMALTHRGPNSGLVHHSDQGCQYTSKELRELCLKAGITLSMGSRADPYDNAVVESFFATLECELIDRHRFMNKEHAELEVFRFIEGFYNRHRRHSSLDFLSPANYERRHRQQLQVNQLEAVH